MRKSAWLLMLVVQCVWVGASLLRCHDERCRYLGRFQFDEDRYEVDGNELWVMYGENGRYLRIKCVDASVLLSSVLPRADPRLIAWDLNVANCHLPANITLAERLAAINVTVEFGGTYDELRGNLTLENLLPEPPLAANLFTGLENLTSLHIYAITRTSAERDFLSKLHNLRSLKMQDVTLPDGELEAPNSLRELILLHTGLKRLPEVMYSSRLLLELTIQSENDLDAVIVPPELRLLDLQSPATILQLNDVPMLKSLTLTYWTELQPPALARCDNLLKLHLMAPAVTTLPYGWLANCSNLRELVIRNAQSLTNLPQRLFGNSHSDLELFALTDGVLESLHEGQFDDACEILRMELNGNRLRTIPSNTLPWTLNELDLSSNDLDSGVLDMVATCYWLSTLNLAENPRFSDACDEKGYSSLRAITSLTTLILSQTNLTRICHDWRQNMHLLETLDLSNTSLSTLSFEDLQFVRTVKAKVLLLGVPLISLEMTRNAYKIAKRTPTSGAFVHLDPSLVLQCDCRMYWTRRTLDRSPHALDRISELRCTNNKLLRKLLPEDMVCAQPEECNAISLPTACSCSMRPDDDPDWDRQMVRVRCENAELRHVPQLPTNSEDRLYELLLAHNLISDLHADDLQNIKGLDLRNNSLRSVDKETATRLGHMGGMLRLADNPLECDCRAAPLLQALHARIPRTTDIENSTCSDGSALYAAPAVNCPPPVAWLAGGLAALFALAVAIVIYLASRERRFFAKAVMHRWGCLWSEPEEDERQYDAFVTFSHKDEDIVLELVARLEPTYRLCLHQRDWIPGLRIPDQIVESVRESRRTLALVSRHFLASTWARAEFREAHEAAMIDDRPRLVVVFLDEPTTLPLNDQLQRYIATHTYLRWGDPWFYNKLAVALPRPRHQRTQFESATFVSSTSSTKVSLTSSAKVPTATPSKFKVQHPLDVRKSPADPAPSSARPTNVGSAMELKPQKMV